MDKLGLQGIYHWKAGMTTIIEQIEANMGLIEELGKTGITASFYSRPPDKKHIFTIGKQSGVPGTIMLWPGSRETEITVVPDKKLHQAVLKVHEPKHTLTFTYTIWHFLSISHGEALQTAADWLGSGPASDYWAGAILPKGTHYRFAPRSKWVTKMGKNDTRLKTAIPIIATVPATTQYFLVGRDELAQFVCALPKEAKTVEEAHKILRPKGVPEGSLRQGEFFFVPVTAKHKKTLQALEKENPKIGKCSWEPNRLEPNSSHRAERRLVLVSGKVENLNNFQISRLGSQEYKTLVKGKITDNKTGHHSPLVLDDWHYAIRNTELQAPPKARRWD